MSGLIKPAALRAGGTLAVLSPASTPPRNEVQAGMEALQGLGYKTVLMPNARKPGPMYYAGTVEQRLADLHAAFADPAIDGIVCTRGGWGSAELLPHLNAELIRANAKAFVGYSDHTSLHNWLMRVAGMMSFYGPMVASDFSRTEGVDSASWGHVFGGDANWSLGADDGLRVLRPGLAEGTLAGGCLSIFAEALGTPYAALPASAEKPRILFLEDVGTKPYQWDRMLLHLRYAGMLDHVAGIVFGDMRQCVAPEEEIWLEDAILHALADFAGPIAIGLRCGHVDGANITLPLGVRVRLDLSAEGNPRVDFLEAAVTV
ncbi:MAG: LD-carboxypeptidase [Acidobacteriaceae bacterium]|nr:LD-carboxypeptidase [Acidobacteriaceae bacterium]